MASDKDIKTDFDDAYQQSFGFWSPFIAMASDNVKFKAGKQWKDKDRKYLEGQRREALTFNKSRRVIKLVTGYQRRNRLAYKLAPVEGGDDRTSDQMTQLMMQLSDREFYSEMADGFEQGALTTGLNLMELWLDFEQDPQDGDIRISRKPHNRFLLDPNVTDRALKTCSYYLTRDYLTKDQVDIILPKSKRSILKNLNPSGRDDKFVDQQPLYDTSKRPIYRYDQFWQRSVKKTKTLYTPAGKTIDLTGVTADNIRMIASQFPEVQIIDGFKNTVTMSVLLEDIVIFNEVDNPTGLDDYNVTPIMGYFESEDNEAELKCQGILQAMRDPQTEANKRRSKILDVMDSAISSGWIAEDGAVINPDALYQSGQGQVIHLTKGKTVANLQKIQSPEVPQSFFQVQGQMDSDIMEIAGANLEMFGQSENGTQIAGILSKLRQAAGLVVFQDLFDNYRFAKQLIGEKKIKIIQKNFSPGKVQRILGEQPTEQFFDEKFNKYDVVVTEGTLTDTQKQTEYMELRALKQEGVAIPDAVIIEAAPLQNKDNLTKALQQQAQSGQQQAQQSQQLTKAQMDLILAEVRKINTEAVKNVSQTKENQTDALLNRVKAMTEIDGIQQDQVIQLFNLVQSLSQPDKQ